jgi:1-acyl-sn-glycerol-3-phosphate acyltransferase
VAFAFPWLPRSARLALKARWSRQLLDTLGVRLLATGAPLDGGLFVANHISWLDIFAINAIAPTAFVAKDDIRGWPVIGWLCVRTETIFLERGSRAAAQRTRQHLVEELRRRHRIGVFPEGTTTYGDQLLPFHSALFQSAIDAGARVVPVALHYREAGDRPSVAAAYVGDTHLGVCLLSIVRASGLTVQVAVLPSLDPATGDRRHLAHRAHTAIAHAHALKHGPAHTRAEVATPTEPAALPAEG